MTGIDTSEELLEIARTVSPAARFVNASVYDALFPDCEAVIARGELVTYHESSDAGKLVSQFFRRAS